jgi:ATP-dependent Clp protease ATP-binding subunit ClpA
MFERFDAGAREAVVQAQLEAGALHHPYLGTEHLLAGVARSDGSTGARLLARLGLAPDGIRDDIVGIVGEGTGRGFDERDRDALRSIGIDLEQVRHAVEGSFGPGALDRPAQKGWLKRLGRRRCETTYVTGHLPFTPRAKKTLELSLREAVNLRSGWIGTEHILLGICRVGDGVPAQIMSYKGIDGGAIRRALADDQPGGAAAL